MAPMPLNETHRVWFDYVSGSWSAAKEHSIMWRAYSGSDLEAVVSGFQARMLVFLTGIGASRLALGWRVIRVRAAAAGSDFSLPVGIEPDLAAFEGSGAYGATPVAFEAIEQSYQARSTVSGRRAKFSVYGILQAQVAEKFRVEPGELPWVAPSLAALTEIGGPQLVAVDGTPVVWYSYVNQNYNSYWERAMRKG